MLSHFQHITLTNDQHNALEQINVFLESKKDIFILKGYAGSGKTTILNGLVDHLNSIGKRYHLMAPTGRAAKVINQKTKKEATTIHKGIYSFDDLKEIKISDKFKVTSFLYYFELRNNLNTQNSVLIVDEASMVSNVLSQGEFFRFGSGFLLNDLIKYSRISNLNNNTKIIFVGDPAQLPPIGMNFSPALDENYLIKEFSLEVMTAELKEVKRQGEESGILMASSKIRKSLTSGYFNDFDLRENGNDVFNPTYENFLSVYNSAQGSKIIITYKNKTALYLNKTIRKNKYGKDLPIRENDTIIIGANNYKLDIMNGEFGIVANASPETISRNIRFYQKGGETISVQLIWRKVKLIFQEENGLSKIVEGLILENYLYGDNVLTPDVQQALYVDFRNRNSNLKSGSSELNEAIKSDLYFNAIFLKFGYAVTCHKAQGGEWENSFVFWDRGVQSNFNFFESMHNRSGKTNKDFYRWAYTAITRSSDKLNCINPPYFTSFSNILFINIDLQNAYQKLNNQNLAPIEILLDDDALESLAKLNLQKAPIPIQDHFLKLNHIVSTQFIDIINWERIKYEIRYYFKREEETAAFKFWINGNYTFKSNYQKLPYATNSNNFFNEIAELINTKDVFIINRSLSGSILSKINFEIEIEEAKPFLKNLFDFLSFECIKLDIQIEKLDHHNYRERYFFIRNNENVAIDFEYDSKGFFGRILPLENKCNSEDLLEELKLMFKKLETPVNVI